MYLVKPKAIHVINNYRYRCLILILVMYFIELGH